MPIIYIQNVPILTEVLWNDVHMTTIDITILTEDSWNVVHMTTIEIAIPTDDLWNGVHKTTIDITIPTEDLLNGVQRTMIYITIPTEDLLNGVQRTMIYITIPTDVLGMMSPVLSRVPVTRSLVLCVCFVDLSLSFVLFLLAIILSVLRCMDSDYTLISSNSSRHNYSYKGFVKRCQGDNNGYENSHRGFVQRYSHDDNNHKTYVINKVIRLFETFGHTVKYTVFVGCAVLILEVRP